VIPDLRTPESSRPTPTLADPETALTAAERETPHGPLWVASALYADTYRHGSLHAAAARAWDPHALAALCRDPSAALPPESWCFLDVETTGLGLHAGTVAFLVGLGWVSPGGLRVEQYLMRDPAEEPALLHAVASVLQGFAGVVTFNGKTFDLPLLAVRAAMARRSPPHAGLVHCDLLHAARRAWSHRTTSCRLVALEKQFLGLRRHDDLDGAAIPQVYLDALRSGRGEMLDPILTHNRHDLLSLMLLTAAAARFLERARAGAPPPGRGEPAPLAADWLRAARVYVQAGDEPSAIALLERCLGDAVPVPERQASRALLAQLHKRRGDWAGACALWEQMLTEDPAVTEPYAEIAKVLEHRRHDPDAALAWVEKRLDGAGLDAEARAAFAHRRARLQRKLQPGSSLTAFL
jgi:uncharacterized protein